MFASSSRAVARRFPVATTQLLSRPLVIRPVLVSRSFTVSHRVLFPNSKTASDKGNTTTKKSAAKIETKKAAGRPAKSTSQSPKPTKEKEKKKPGPKTSLRKKKELTPEEKEKIAEKAKLRELRDKAMLKDEPKSPTASPWSTHLSHFLKGRSDMADNFDGAVREAKEKYDNLSPHEMETLRVNTQNARAAGEAYRKEWIKSHPVEVIALANKARRSLKRLGKAVRILEDDRMPKAPASPYFRYLDACRNELSAEERNESQSVLVKRFTAGWHTLTEEERKPFNEAYEQDKAAQAGHVQEIQAKVAELEKAHHKAAKLEEVAKKEARKLATAERRKLWMTERAAKKAAGDDE